MVKSNSTKSIKKNNQYGKSKISTITSERDTPITNIGIYSSSVNDLRKHGKFENEFMNNCHIIGKRRHSTYKDLDMKVEPLYVRDLTNYCKCCLDQLGDKTLLEIKKKDKNIEKSLSVCVNKLHTSQKSKNILRSVRKTAKDKNIKSKGRKKTIKSKSKSIGKN
jgi:hypothetical protein